MNKENLLLGMIGIITLSMIIIGVNNLKGDDPQFEGNSFSQCRTLSETVVTIGHQESTEVLSATSGRSYVMLQLVTTNAGVATNTPSVSFSSTATLADGIKLSTTTPTLVLGMDTDHAYQGAVSMITDQGSTTVRKIECR